LKAERFKKPIFFQISTILNSKQIYEKNKEGRAGSELEKTSDSARLTWHRCGAGGIWPMNAPFVR
jgi:hypothetical protein